MIQQSTFFDSRSSKILEIWDLELSLSKFQHHPLSVLSISPSLSIKFMDIFQKRDGAREQGGLAGANWETC